MLRVWEHWACWSAEWVRQHRACYSWVWAWKSSKGLNVTVMLPFEAIKLSGRRTVGGKFVRLIALTLGCWVVGWAVALVGGVRPLNRGQNFGTRLAPQGCRNKSGSTKSGKLMLHFLRSPNWRSGVFILTFTPFLYIRLQCFVVNYATMPFQLADNWK